MATKKRPKLSSSHARSGGTSTASKVKSEKKREPDTRCGTIAIVGRPNVGKSTLVNALVGFRLSITTSKPQTTRDRILGILTRETLDELGRPLGTQLIFLDTPGLHRPRNRLGVAMNAHAEEAARDADLVVYVTDYDPRGTEADQESFARVKGAIAEGTPIVLAINKVDRAKDKGALLGTLEAFSKLHDFAAYVPISAARGGHGKSSGLERLLDEIGKRLPRGAFLFPEDELTDRPERFLAAECVREQVILQTRDEIPYAIAVTIDSWEEPASSKQVTRIEATIHVDKDAQRKIVVGHGGDRIKEIGVYARKAIEATLGRRVHLGLYVRTEEGWAHDERKLAELGYEVPPE